ncbi:MAG: hypothetical protein IT443_05445 [Phycisphaeraceae bacterium]|nr:hypothetical protein [Phycisphaeraceae bacterium]
MTIGRFATVGLLVYLLAVLGAYFASASSPPDSQLPTPNSSSFDPARPLLGFALNFHHTSDLPAYLKAIDQIADMGFDSVEILTPAFQENGAAESIAVVVAPGKSPSRADLVALLTHAKKRGLRTLLMPIVLLSNPRGNEWRGKISPEDWSAWWRSYRQYLDYAAAVANEADVDALAVGSELISTEAQTQNWVDLIQHLRRRFPRLLFYSTNWDHYEKPQFWSHLDAIGINGYWDIATLTAADNPDPALLTARWAQIRQQIVDFAAAQGRPILLTEVGYPSLPWALSAPWNYIADSHDPADHQAQALGYQAFLSAFDNLLSPAPTTAPASVSALGSAGGSNVNDPSTPAAFAGVMFYAWDPYHSGGDDDKGYGVLGKPAAQLLSTWLSNRPSPK